MLGRTGLKVSEIGFGGWAIGGMGYGDTNDSDSLKALEKAWNLGINFYDTADTYGKGHSEILISRFLKGKPKDEIIIATKVGWDFNSACHQKNFDLNYISFACEESLKRLNVETIDLYQLHNPSLELIKRGEVIGVLEKLKKEGKIRFIGISVHLEEEAAEAMNDTRVDCLQVILNLLDQRMEKKVFPEAVKRGVGIVVREPLASGLLSGKYNPSHVFPKNDHRRRWSQIKREVDHKKIEMINEILKKKNISLLQAALEYTIMSEAVSVVIPGAKTDTQVKENLKASLKPKLSEKDIDLLKELYNKENIFKQELLPRNKA